MLRSPRRNCRPLIGSQTIDEENNNDECIAIRVDPPQEEQQLQQPQPRRNSLDNSMMVIPTFTVTINPMTADEITYVPDSPSTEVKANNNADLSDELRRCSIGSATSLTAEDEKEAKEDTPPPSVPTVTPPPAMPSGPSGSLLVPSRTLSIRRVSEISHINEMRRELSGMEHLASEYYEISREPNPDAISLDSIHKTVFRRCQNKYMPAQRTTRQSKYFVVITSGCTIFGIIYGFWYKNFGPGRDVEMEAH